MATGEKNDIAVFFVNSLQNGGAERVVVNQATELLNRQYGVYLILIHDKVAYKIDNRIHIDVLYKNTGKIDKFLKRYYIAGKLDKKIDEISELGNIALMSVHLPFAHSVCRLSKYCQKFIYVMHNAQYQYRFSETAMFRMRLKYLYNKQNIVTVSKGVRDELICDYGVKPMNIRAIYNPIDIDEIQNKISQETINDIIEEKYILFVGRLTSQKKIDRLIKAFYIGKFYEQYRLVILGVGELEKELKALVNEMGLIGSVFFCGWESNVYKWMNKAELLVCSSEYESFGMVIAEALCCGSRVVSTNCKFGPSEILEDEYAKYLSDLNSESLCEKMKDALAYYPDNNLQLIHKFDVRIIMQNYLDTYAAWNMNR